MDALGLAPPFEPVGAGRDRGCAHEPFLHVTPPSSAVNGLARPPANYLPTRGKLLPLPTGANAAV
jgi:hypothetical protein